MKVVDEVWNLPTEGRFTDPADEARYLGEMVVAQSNRGFEGIPSGRPERTRIQYANERMTELAGHEADFAEGFDSTIDFSLNSDWRS